MKPAILRSLFLSACALALAAQEVPKPAAAADDEQELLSLLNTPISGASKRAQRLIDSPQAVEVLTGKEIREMGIHRLVDGLKTMTSIDVIELDNQATVVGLRGVMQNGNPRTVQVLVDGVPLYNSALGSIDFDNLPVPLEAIERVEVVRGPSSSLYGANAVAGVIAITTRKADKAFSGDASLSVANLKTRRWSVDGRTQVGGFGLLVGYEGASIGNSQGPYTNVDPSSSTGGGGPQSQATTIYDRDHSHQFGYLVRPTYAWQGGSLWASVAGSHKQNELGGQVPFSYLGTEVGTSQAGWHQDWTAAFATEVRFNHSHSTSTMPGSTMLASIMASAAAQYPTLGLDPETEIAKEFKMLDFSQDMVEFQVNWTASENLHVVGGVDTRRYQCERTIFLGLPATAKESASGAFASVDWRLAPTFSLSLGGRVENDSVGGSRFSPRAAFVWNPTPESALRGGFFTATRSPQILEQNENTRSVMGNASSSVSMTAFAPNPGLRPEKITDLELGYRQSLGAFTVDLTLFRMTISQLIEASDAVVTTSTVANPAAGTEGQPATLPLSISTVTYQNRGEEKDKGVELAVSYAASRHWSTGANVTLLDYKPAQSGTGTSYATSDNIAYAPKLKANLWGKVTAGRFHGYAALQHVGAAVTESAASFATSATFGHRAAFTALHASAEYEVGRGFAIGAYGRNLNRNFTEQGAGGITGDFSALRFTRKEFGGTLSYRW